MLKKIRGIILTLTFMILCSAPAFAVNLTAFAHVENIGDQTSTAGQSISIGTTGQCLQMEGFTLKTDNPNVIPVYEAHVEDYGWMPQVENGAFAGTRGEHKRIECFKISLKGSEADNYDIYYRAHVQEYGWLDWAKNGQSAGTAQHAFRCEALELQILPKDSPAPGDSTVPAVEAVTREEGEHMFYVNMLRKSIGKNMLTGDPILHAAGDFRAQEVAQKFEHIRPNGQQGETAWNDYLAQNGISPSGHPIPVGENIANGTNGPYGDYVMFYNSEGHRRTMQTGNVYYFTYNVYRTFGNIGGVVQWFACRPQ